VKAKLPRDREFQFSTDGDVDACMHGIRRRPLWTTAACSPRLECLAKARSRSGCSSFVDCRAPHARLRWHAAGGRWRRASAQCQCHRAGRSIDRELGMARCFGPVCKQQQLVGAGLELAAPPNWAACNFYGSKIYEYSNAFHFNLSWDWAMHRDYVIFVVQFRIRLCNC
jgi:hypothetical protein